MILFKDAFIIDGVSREPFLNASVMIEGNRIVEVGRDLTAPSGAQVIHLGGRTLLPGFTEAHIHMGGSDSFDAPPLLGGENSSWYQAMRSRLLDYGITNVRSAGDFEDDMVLLQAKLRSGELEGPRVWISGKAFQPVGGHPAYTVWQSSGAVLEKAVVSPETTRQAREEVQRQAASGVNHVKCFLADDNYMDPSHKAPKLDTKLLNAIIEEAHSLGLKTMVHCQEPGFALEALKAGADSVEHMICSGHEEDRLPSDLAEAFIKNNAFLVPTLASAYYYGFNPDVQIYLASAVKVLFDKGVKIAAGTDTGTPNTPPGAALHKEMELLVNAGIPPMDAIIAATRHGAEIVGSDSFGVILPGKLADLVVLEGNPLEDITQTKNICLVMKEGKILRNNLRRGCRE